MARKRPYVRAMKELAPEPCGCGEPAAFTGELSTGETFYACHKVLCQQKPTPAKHQPAQDDESPGVSRS